MPASELARQFTSNNCEYGDASREGPRGVSLGWRLHYSNAGYPHSIRASDVKAILCQRFGTPDDLVLADIADPVAGPGEVVARVAAVGLNFFDTLLIAGKYQVKPPFPFSPGGELAGVVESVGPGVTAFAPGDRVMGYSNFNAARERTAVAADWIVKIPPGLDFERAAALTVIYGTAYHALEHRAGLRSGETLAVLGASGGAGLKRLGGEHGIDVVFDPVGGPFSEAAVRSLAWGGRHLVIGFAAGEIPKLPLNLVLLKGCAVIGVFWGAWVRHHNDQYQAAISRLAGWCAAGKLSCAIQRVYPLAQTAQALKALAERRVKGKLVVRIGE